MFALDRLHGRRLQQRLPCVHSPCWEPGVNQAWTRAARWTLSRVTPGSLSLPWHSFLWGNVTQFDKCPSCLWADDRSEWTSELWGWDLQMFTPSEETPCIVSRSVCRLELDSLTPFSVKQGNSLTNSFLFITLWNSGLISMRASWPCKSFEMQKHPVSIFHQGAFHV